MKLYLLQIDLSTVHHSCGVGESKPRLQVLQFNLQGADLLIAVQQVRFCHGVERLRDKETKREEDRVEINEINSQGLSVHFHKV